MTSLTQENKYDAGPSRLDNLVETMFVYSCAKPGRQSLETRTRYDKALHPSIQACGGTICNGLKCSEPSQQVEAAAAIRPSSL